TLEKDATSKGGDAYAQKLGDFWLACMDEAAIEKAGTKPLEAPFSIVDRLGKEVVINKDQKASASDVSGVVRDLYKLGITPLFGFYSGQDAADATKVIGQLDQGGLGLPDRDYYFKTDAKSKEIRAQYEEHVAKMLELAGAKADDAKAQAKRVMAVETELAKASQTKVERRQPKNIYHRMTLAEIQKLAPAFDWKGFLGALNVSDTAPINVLPPAFIKGLETRLAKTTAADWQAYFRWHVVHQLAHALPKAFVDENFRFRSTAFTGAKANLPRWKRCVDAADAALGEALAQPFVRDHFGAEGKTKTQSMVVEIERVMAKNLAALPWMDDATRKKAEEKLAKINNKIGFPDAWRNYDKLAITRASYAENVMHSDAFELERVLAKIGKPLDRKEWYMSPPTVNAYYDANMNEMVFPAGILQPPFFDRAAPIAMNYGAIGLVMGHELTHGFDDEGRQYDGDGNLKEWWSPKVSKDFDKRAACVVKQYNDYVAIDELHVDGKLTLGENIADLGGLKLAYAAYVEATKTTAPPEKPATYTPNQE
ncbi:MAG: M13 family metallopeptidase, partial [Polyangiales bacterium]